ncbi:MAG: hypothetical protein V3R94_05270 [Acidobacteriota bacterium]
MNWMTVVIALVLWAAFGGLIPAQDSGSMQSPPCQSALQERNLPIRLKTRGSVETARWEQVDEVLAGLDRDLKALDCRFRFNELFETRRQELFFPLTNNVVRTVPESSLAGVAVFNPSEERLGEYVSRVEYTRTGGLENTDSYTLYYFQYRDSEGEIHTSGSQLLLDSYRVRWSDIAESVGFDTADP